MGSDLKIDEIGYWTEIKLSILEKYAKPYNQILLAHHLHPIYIDGFAGAGYHKAKGSDRIIEGSPSRALTVDPPFDFLHFVDLDGARVGELRKLASDRPNVAVYEGDCNKVLVDEVFPKVSYGSRQRALCILDPYGLHLDWQTIRRAGESKVIEIFLNFPVMDMNMNVFWHRPEGVTEAQRERMTRFWGDDSWKEAAYETTQGLFEPIQVKASNDTVAEAFRTRLKNIAGFTYVPKPIPMRNTKGAIVYFLFFAAQEHTADKIVRDIFAKYESYGEVANG
jgi:three-Cys-motif partner protein